LNYRHIFGVVSAVIFRKSELHAHT
jgi:hypothetical protein